MDIDTLARAVMHPSEELPKQAMRASHAQLTDLACAIVRVAAETGETRRAVALLERIFSEMTWRGFGRYEVKAAADAP